MHVEVDKIRTKQAQNPWPKYLSSIQIDGLRGWSGEEVRFQFPVSVVCGENGCGKSTILKAAAAAYGHPRGQARTYFHSKFFPDTPWETVTNATLTYRLREGSENRVFVVRKLSARWRATKNRPRRDVILQDISRTLPIEATVGYAYIAKRTAQEVSALELSDELTRYYSSIMGRAYDSARFAISDVDKRRQVGVLRHGTLEFSQFHQGAGEDATLDLMSLLQNVPHTALVILDEVEASLHPRSQRRLIHFLLWLARTKQVQVILSTHSPYVLEELPSESRIFLDRKANGIDVIYGVTPSFALNRMDDIERPDLYIMTEDVEATALVSALLRLEQLDLTRISFVEVGPANVVASVGVAARRPRFPVHAIGVMDADQEPHEACLRLPGTRCPERQVFEDIRDHAVTQFALRIGLALEAVLDALGRTMSLMDPHQWPSQLARLLGLTNVYLWETMTQVWAKECVAANEIRDFVQPIRDMLVEPHGGGICTASG